MGYETVTYKRKELYEQAWSEPMIKLAPKYGLSDNGLRKICKKLNIPLPPQGYWIKLQYGKADPRPALPPAQENEDTVERWIGRDMPELDEAEKTKFQKLIDFEKNAKNLIRVSAVLRNPHPYIQQTREVLKNAKKDEYGRLWKWRAKYLDISVSPKELGRALRIMDALIKALERRNFKVTIDENVYRNQDETYVTILGEKIRFRIQEPSNKRDREPTAQEKKDGYRGYPRFEFFPSGKLSLMINEYTRGRKTCEDGKKQRLENCLNDFVIALIRVAEKDRARRLEREREERERREWERQRDEKIQLIREEEVVIWAGAGLSFYAGFPSGKKLGEILVESLSKNSMGSSLNC